MPDLKRLQIICPSASPSDIRILLDGEELSGVCSISLSITPDKLVTATLELLPKSLEIDAQVIERVFASPPE